MANLFFYRCFPAPTSHGGCFTRAEYDRQLANPESLDVYDVWRPLVGLGDLANIEQNGLRGMAADLTLCWFFEQARNNPPDGRCVRFVRVMLGEIKDAGTIRGSGGKGVSQGGWTSPDTLAAWQCERKIGHVVENMNGLHPWSSNISSTGCQAPVQSKRSVVLTLPNLEA